MEQITVQQFTSECGMSTTFVQNGMPIGRFHDFLMQVKGLMVERMIIAHKEQLAQAEAAKNLPPHESEVSALPDQLNESAPECAKE